MVFYFIQIVEGFARNYSQKGYCICLRDSEGLCLIFLFFCLSFLDKDSMSMTNWLN
jgi:hypothetical protein